MIYIYNFSTGCTIHRLSRPVLEPECSPSVQQPCLSCVRYTKLLIYSCFSYKLVLWRRNESRSEAHIPANKRDAACSIQGLWVRTLVWRLLACHPCYRTYILLWSTRSMFPKLGVWPRQVRDISGPEQEVKDTASQSPTEMTFSLENLKTWLHESTLLSDRLNGHKETGLILHARCSAPAVSLVSKRSLRHTERVAKWRGWRRKDIDEGVQGKDRTRRVPSWSIMRSQLHGDTGGIRSHSC